MTANMDIFSEALTRGPDSQPVPAGDDGCAPCLNRIAAMVAGRKKGGTPKCDREKKAGMIFHEVGQQVMPAVAGNGKIDPAVRFVTQLSGGGQSNIALAS